MSAGTHYKIKSSRLSHQTFEDETVIVDLESGSYYSLNKTGTELWCLLTDGITGEEMATEVSRRYEGDPQEMQQAMNSFLAELEQANLVETAQDGGRMSRPEPHTAVPTGTKRPFEAPTLDTYTDMQELLLLDPIHEADETGWPSAAPQAAHEGG